MFIVNTGLLDIFALILDAFHKNWHIILDKILINLELYTHIGLIHKIDFKTLTMCCV